MITAPKLTEIEVPHRIDQVAVASGSGAVVMSGSEAAAWYVAPDVARAGRLALPLSPRSVALAPSAAVLAIVDAAGVSLNVPATGERLAAAAGDFEGCAFTADGRWLCAARRTGDDLFAAELRDGRTLGLVAACEVADPFGGSSCMVFPHPDPSRLCLWMAAGQDGQVCVALACDGMKLAAARLTDLEETTPPAFSPGGDRFLVVHGNELRHYSFPDGRLLGELSWEDEEDPLAEQLCFIDGASALVCSNNSRLHLVDVPNMAVVDEVAVEGHPPRPVRELYPILKEDAEWATDLRLFEPRRDGTFVSIHERLPLPSEKWRGDLVLWRLGGDGTNHG